MTTRADLAIDLDHGNFQLGNEVFEAARAVFVRNPAIPDIYDANHVAQARARTPEEINELFAEVERQFPHSNHRRYLVDHRTPPEFIARLLLDGGFTYTAALCLVLEGELVGRPPVCDIRPLESESEWQALLEMTRADFQEHRLRANEPDPGDHVPVALHQSKRWRQPPVQYWLAFVDGKAVAHFHSWPGLPGMGQVEDLYVRPEFRNRGIATALIHHCVAEVRKAGVGPVLIVADAADTPKHIYARMGFQPVAVAGAYHEKLV